MSSGLWMELVNSDRHDYLGTGKRVDSLDDPAWLDSFLKRWGLEAGRVSRDRLLPALRRLRRILQREADAVAAGRRVEGPALRSLNVCLEKSPLIRRLRIERGRARVSLEPVRRTEVAIVAEIVSSFVETLAGGEASRLKLCGNEDCRWVFADGSKNRTRRWCGPTCGSLMKVRRFRERRKT